MKYLFVWAILSSSYLAGAQVIENVLNSGGNQAEDNRGNTVTFSMGETIIDGKVDSPLVATQGVIQHEIIIQTSNINFDNLKLSVYPNPTSRMVHLEYSGNISSLTIQLYDLNGKLVEFPFSMNQNKAVIDLSNLAPAQYHLIVQKENLKNSYKIFKSH